MKLGEALNTLKKEKNRVSRLISLRKENVFVEKGEHIKFDPERLSQEIDEKREFIRELQIKIQKINLNTIVKGERITLAEAIIKIRQIRDKITNLSCLFERGYSFRDSDDKEKVAQLDKLKVEKEIENLEVEKVDLDNKIQITNWETDILN
ncbi:hypothetical protein HYX16_00420 [Candidatus Woesearchaeota archaeon]|nr:hypothetical protein [Candidatus Woesearchaeota archaeon]